MSLLNCIQLFGFFLLIVESTSGAVVPDTDFTTKSSDSLEENVSSTLANNWLDKAHIYHVLPRSFQDSNADGDGDLQGIIRRLDYLRDVIGVDVMRLGPIYASPMLDSGYDVSNFTDINEIYGDFDDFEQLVDQIHEKGMKIILDVVPNHSSDRHDWFIESAAGKEPYDDYYIWADGNLVDNKLLPPNNWKSAYSDDDGSAWTWNKQRRQWYYHKFHDSEPDLNLRNEDVVEEIMKVLDFWLEKGIDGFCLNGMSYLVENVDLLNESDENDADGDNDADGNDDDDSYTIGEKDNLELTIRFRKHVDDWAEENDKGPILMLGEIDEDDDTITSFYGNETHPGVVPLNTLLITELNETSNADDVKNLIEDWLDLLPEDAEPIWMLSNQDNSRIASRFNDSNLDGLFMLAMLLPGRVLTYYGEEIGMTDTNVTWEETIDQRALAQGEDDFEENSRDPFRTPMQWDDTTSAGFSLNETTFLPINDDYSLVNVEKQLLDLDSNLLAYKKLSAMRKNPIFSHGNYNITVVNDDEVLILKRSYDKNSCLVVVNFGSERQTVNLTDLYDDNLEKDLQVMIDSSNANVENVNDEDDDDDIENDSFILDAYAAAVLCDKQDFEESDNSTLAYNTTTEDDVESTTDTSTTTITTEEPVVVVGFPTKEPEPNSATSQKIVQFVLIANFVSLLFLT